MVSTSYFEARSLSTLFTRTVQEVHHEEKSNAFPPAFTFDRHLKNLYFFQYEPAAYIAGNALSSLSDKEERRRVSKLCLESPATPGTGKAIRFDVGYIGNVVSGSLPKEHASPNLEDNDR